MAARAPEVTEERAESGAAVLALTDRVGFDAYAAAWLYDEETETWRFVLSSPMLGERGPEWVYARLLRAFHRLELPASVSPLDIFVIDPSVEVAMFGEPDRLPVGPPLPGMRFEVGVPLHEAGGFGAGYAYFFRRLPSEERGRDPSRIFDREVRRLPEAA